MTPQDVRDVFERALQSKRDLEHLRFRMEQLRYKVGSNGIPTAMGGEPGDPVGKAATDIADFERKARRTEAELEAELANCSEVCEGLRKAFNLRLGDVLEDRYVNGLSWDDVAEVNDIGRRTAIRYRDAAFDWIADVGWERAKRGEGKAEL